MKTQRWRTKKQKNIIPHIISIISVAIVVAMWIYLWNEYFMTDPSHTDNWQTNWTWHEENNYQQRYYIWDEIGKEWILTWSDEIRDYTHLFVDKDDYEFWVKSRTISLSNYIDKKVFVQWEVEDITRGLPILEISRIEKLKEEKDKDEDKDNEEETEQTTYYFGQDWIYFDFEGYTWYQASKEDWRIHINEIIENWEDEIESYTWDIDGEIENDEIQEDILTWQNQDKLIQNILTISPFVCEEWSSTKDCQTLKNVFTANSFISANWIEFFDISETNQWIFFNENNWWYYATPRSEDELINISPYIHLFDEQNIETKIEQNIENICKDEDDTISIIDDINIEHQEDGNIKATILGQDRDLNNLTCKIEVILWEDLVTELIEIERSWQPQQTQENNQQREPSNWQTDAVYDIDTQDKQKMESNRWFNIYLPKDMVYAGEIISPAETFWVNWIDCNYRINSTSRQDRDNLENNAILEIYECETGLTENEISDLIWWENLIYKQWSKSEKHFVIKYKDNYENIAKDIIIE